MAVFGDVHGNLPALEAVLAEVDAAGIQTVLNTGDCVAGGAWPNEVVDLLRARRIPTVQGLADLYTAAFVRKREALRRRSAGLFDAVARAHKILRSDNIEFLAALPKELRFVIEGIPIGLYHGSPSGQRATLEAGDGLEHFQRQRERANARIVVCGQTHVPFTRLVDDALFVNPGAAGVPSAEGAAYAVIDTEDDPWRVTFHCASYGMR